MATETPHWHRDVLAFWFDELTPEQWFDSSGTVDDVIRARFGGLHERLSEDLPDDVMASPERALAAIIVLDQFSRNLHRGTGEAFANDRAARELAVRALDTGMDSKLDPSQRHFVYMPFMHSESLADQDRAVDLFEGTDSAKWAHQHRDIIAEFGRFPHRNDALGRESTQAEKRYLEDAERFGQ